MNLIDRQTTLNGRLCRMHINIEKIRNMGDDAWHICGDYGRAGNKIWGDVGALLRNVTASKICNQLKITLQEERKYDGSHTN